MRGRTRYFTWEIRRHRGGFTVKMDETTVGYARTRRDAEKMRDKMQKDVDIYAKTGRWARWKP